MSDCTFLNEELVRLKIELNNEKCGHDYTKRNAIKRLRTVLKANERDRKQVVDYMLQELIEELSK